MDHVQVIVDEIHAYSPLPVFCHGDFHLGQVLLPSDGQEVKLIDWTEAGIGDRFFDLAKFALPFNEKETEKLLIDYLHEMPSACDKRHFEQTQKLVLITIVLNRLYKAKPKIPLTQEHQKQLIQEMDDRLKTHRFMSYLDPNAFSSPETLRESALSALSEFIQRENMFI